MYKVARQPVGRDEIVLQLEALRRGNTTASAVLAWLVARGAVKAEDLKSEDLKSEDLKSEDLKSEDLKSEDLKKDGRPPILIFLDRVSSADSIESLRERIQEWVTVRAL